MFNQHSNYYIYISQHYELNCFNCFINYICVFNNYRVSVIRVNLKYGVNLLLKDIMIKRISKYSGKAHGSFTN